MSNRAVFVRSGVVGSAAAVLLAACASSAPSTTPQTVRATPSPSSVTASPSPSASPPATAQQVTLAPGVTFDLPAGWTVQSQDPEYLVSADKLTRVLFTLGVYTGDGPRPSSASAEISSMVKDAQSTNGAPARAGLQMSNLQAQPVKNSSSGPWDQVAEQDYTATVNGQSVKGILEELLNTASGTGVFLQSISTPDLSFSNGVNSILASLAADSHPR